MELGSGGPNRNWSKSKPIKSEASLSLVFLCVYERKIGENGEPQLGPLLFSERPRTVSIVPLAGAS